VGKLLIYAQKITKSNLKTKGKNSPKPNTLTYHIEIMFIADVLWFYYVCG
jgi:hypothetical protein